MYMKVCQWRWQWRWWSAHESMSASLALMARFLAPLYHFNMFEQVTSTPSPLPFHCYSKHLFCDVHIELPWSVTTTPSPLPLLATGNLYFHNLRIKFCLYQFSTSLEYFEIFDDVMTTPSPHPLITQDLHFSNLHAEISLCTNFQPGSCHP